MPDHKFSLNEKVIIKIPRKGTVTGNITLVGKDKDGNVYSIMDKDNFVNGNAIRLVKEEHIVSYPEPAGFKFDKGSLVICSYIPGAVLSVESMHIKPDGYYYNLLTDTSLYRDCKEEFITAYKKGMKIKPRALPKCDDTVY